MASTGTSDEDVRRWAKAVYVEALRTTVCARWYSLRELEDIKRFVEDPNNFTQEDK